MKIISWNVNGLRSLPRLGAWEPFLSLQGDVLCLQEIKAEKEQLSEELLNPEGYKAYFSSSKERKGYSGVAIYSKKEPYEVRSGMDSDPEDKQGRVLSALYDDIAVVNVYVPNGASKTAPLPYKLSFYEDLLDHAETLRGERGTPVVIVGDLNVAHHEVDLARPKQNEGRIGFLPEEREWISEFRGHGFIDVYRERNPNERDVYTYWDQITRARERNVGWRIDYALISEDGYEQVQNFITHTQILGSDHCPIEIVL